jgi:electron transfer flavoprotein alpha subunit
MSGRKTSKAVWVFGDYRNYFQNRVTLQLLAKARELASDLGGKVCALVLGHQLDYWTWEYICHGADVVYAVDHPSLEYYQIETYTRIVSGLAAGHEPEMILVGATGFGKELAARCAARLGTGLTADCVDLGLDDSLNLMQTAPAFGGNLLAECLIPQHRPQMATVRPGVFRELPHDNHREGKIIKVELPADLPPERLTLISSERRPEQERNLETAKVVICGGRGMGSKRKFKNLFELAALLGGEVGATRPVVHSRWIGEEALVGQAGKQVKPQVLFSFGASGAIQHTAGITGAEFIVAVNKNPKASIMQMADVGIVADANQVCLALIRELKERMRT